MSFVTMGEKNGAYSSKMTCYLHLFVAPVSCPGFNLVSKGSLQSLLVTPSKNALEFSGQFNLNCVKVLFMYLRILKRIQKLLSTISPMFHWASRIAIGHSHL